MIELVKFKAKSKVDDSEDIVLISKSGTITFGLLSCEKAKVTAESYMNCYFDKNNPNEIYLQITKHDPKKSVEGYVAQPNRDSGEDGESSIRFNITTFLKRAKYHFTDRSYYQFEVIDIGGTDYLRINLAKQVGAETP